MHLVLHHDYSQGDATDHSGHGNHGTALSPNYREVEGRRGLTLDGSRSRVTVPPSRDLTGITGLRVSVTALLRTVSERNDLVEGYLSFALLVHGDGSVQGGTYNGSTWITTRSDPGLVREGKWHQVTYLYRTWLGSTIYVDDHLVAWDPRADVLNSVSWPFGVSVGAWPDADRFMLNGTVGELLIWTEGD